MRIRRSLPGNQLTNLFPAPYRQFRLFNLWFVSITASFIAKVIIQGVVVAMDKEQLRHILVQVSNRVIHYRQADDLISKALPPAPLEQHHESDNFSPQKPTKIAVIGIGCRLPGADDSESFWHNLCAGGDYIQEISPGRWPLAGFFDPEQRDAASSYSKWGGFIDAVADFDADFFQLAIADVLSIDPQQLLALEVAWQTLENAGYGAAAHRPRNIGIFLGSRASNLTLGDLAYGKNNPDNRNYVIGKAQNMTAARIAHHFNLTGPTLVVDTACSSSLVSVHLACRSLASGECDMALAGGIDLLLTPETYIGLSKAKALSPDGKCFVFDKCANGYVPGGRGRNGFAQGTAAGAGRQ